MKQVTFIHAADLHLDSPMLGLSHLPQTVFKRLQESTFTSFTKIVDAAIKHKVDFVILAGDLFDGEDRSIRAQARFRKQMERLNSYQIPVYIIHGNHDHLDGKWANIALPENAVIFPGEVKMHFWKQDSPTVSLYGFSYPKRNVTEKIINDYKKTGDADFHIGILHGQLEGNLEHGNYAPFTLHDLLDKQFDYWALGHIHKRAQLSIDPPIVYPGNIQGRHRKESGEKGCFLVTLTESDHRLEFLSTCDVIWEEMIVDGSKAKNLSDLYQLCRNTIEAIRREGVGILLTLTIEGVNFEEQQNKLSDVGELLETLREEEKEEESFVWFVDLVIEESKLLSREQLAGEADFFEELFNTSDTYQNWDECLAPLYHHPGVRRFLTQLTETEKQQLLHEAENQLLKKLIEE